MYYYVHTRQQVEPQYNKSVNCFFIVNIKGM